MVKVARTGAVKTRLARDIGSVAATAFYRASSEAVIGRLGRDSRWRLVIAISPDHELRHRAWRAADQRIGQGAGDLGHRMQRLFNVLPPGPVVIAGSDIPGICPEHIWRCFKLAERYGAVLAPALDGGYWAIGQRRVPRTLAPFDGVRWSHPQTLADTARGFAPVAAATADAIGDVDDGAAWLSVRAWSGRRILPIR